MEQCKTSRYDYAQGQYVVENVCDIPITVQFMVSDQPAVERRLDPDETFATGLRRSDWAISATCPDGYVSSPPFLPENREAIAASLYGCVPE